MNRTIGRAALCLIAPLLLAACVSQSVKGEMAKEYYNLGNAYYEIREYDRAIAYYNLAISQDPELLGAHYNLSLAFIKGGREEEAERVLLRLLERDPENVSVLQLLAYVYYQSGSVVQAIETVESVLRLSPNDVDALHNMGIIYWEDGQAENAARAFDDLLEILPADGSALYTETLFNHGQLLMQMGEEQKAVDQLERYLVWHEQDLEAQRLLARAYAAVEQYDRALEALDRVLGMDDSLGEVWFEKAVILLTQIEDPVQGLSALEEALERGFSDQERIESLVEDPDLIDKSDVQDILKDYGRAAVGDGRS